MKYLKAEAGPFFSTPWGFGILCTGELWYVVSLCCYSLSRIRPMAGSDTAMEAVCHQCRVRLPFSVPLSDDVFYAVTRAHLTEEREPWEALLTVAGLDPLTMTLVASELREEMMAIRIEDEADLDAVLPSPEVGEWE